MKPSYDQLLTALAECAAACNTCASSCLDEDDVHMMTECIRLDMDCAGICNLMAALVARDSEFVPSLTEVCAEICTRCATECEKHPVDHCQLCAEACRKCADACRTHE